MDGRNADKLAAAAQDVGSGPETYLADLSRLEQVAAMADAIKATHTRLDVLINNAGVLKVPQARAPSGRDIRFEVNTLAPYDLTCRLLPIMPPDGRVVNLSDYAT